MRIKTIEVQEVKTGIITITKGRLVEVVSYTITATHTIEFTDETGNSNASAYANLLLANHREN